ncbi:MAG: hypothetical protein O3A20_07080 [Planctomycetota bacterium]|nr:hypothetical protein [Planctomycetota bacterium]
MLGLAFALVSGVEQWNARVEPDPAVLLRWAAEDDDRTRQFDAEIALDLTPSSKR